MNIFKKSVLLVMLLALSCMAFAQQQYDNPVAYLSAMGQEHQAISKDMWRYINAMAHGKSGRKVENRRKEVLATIKNAQTNVSRMPAYKGDKSLRDSVAAYLKLSYQVMNEDYAKIVDMEEIAEQSYDAMEAYMLAKERANLKLDQASERMNNQQRVFALAHNIQLVDGQSKIGAKLERAGEVFEHYNKHYLIFFKSFKQEAYLMQALEQNDINGLEQNKMALKQFAAEGIAKLDTLPRFKTDLTLKQSNLQMQAFFNREADMISGIVDFLLKKEKFEQLQKAMDAKRPADRTKEDVDQFNKAVNEYNASINQYNNTLNQLNKERARHIDQWNKSTQSFLDKYVSR